MPDESSSNIWVISSTSGLLDDLEYVTFLENPEVPPSSSKVSISAAVSFAEVGSASALDVLNPGMVILTGAGSVFVELVVVVFVELFCLLDVLLLVAFTLLAEDVEEELLLLVLLEVDLLELESTGAATGDATGLDADAGTVLVPDPPVLVCLEAVAETP